MNLRAACAYCTWAGGLKCSKLFAKRAAGITSQTTDADTPPRHQRVNFQVNSMWPVRRMHQQPLKNLDCSIALARLVTKTKMKFKHR